MARTLAVLALALAGVLGGALAGAVPAVAAPSTVTAQALSPAAGAALPQALPAPAPPTPPAPRPSPARDGELSVTVDPNLGKPSQAVTVILLLSVLSVAPALLVLCTSFTKIIVVLSLTRNALGTPTIPPNQVLAGLALFLSLFIMSPVLSQINDDGVQPYLRGDLDQSQAYDAGVEPLREFMLEQTRKPELATMVQLSGQEPPETPEDVAMSTLIPAFVLSELKSAFIIGFVVFIPFLIIDLVVSSALMSLGMMMLPPVLVSLPFKLLLFVMVDGWDLIAKALVTSYQ